MPAALPSLPAFTAPESLDVAAAAIMALGKNIHEHAYIIGKTLAWVKDEVGHGNFISWVKENVWFAERTARNFMAFAETCDAACAQVEYTPSKTATIAVLPDPSDPSAGEPIEPEVIDPPRDSTEQEDDTLPNPTRLTVPRANGQEFVEERRTIGEILPMLKSARKRLLTIAHMYGLSERHRTALRRVLTDMLKAVEETE